LCNNVIKLVGNDSAKAKKEATNRLTAVKADEPLIVVATGKYVGEGFDLPRLDTLMFALPVSWKGLIAQYAGRLHRDYPGKTEVRIYDYVDLRVPVCDSMYRKRLHGYKEVGYSVEVANEGIFAEEVTDTIFTYDNFESIFQNDLAAATQSIIISTTRLRWNRSPKVIDLLQASMTRGVCVSIIISEIGHNESELQSSGINVIHRPNININCAVIDKCIGWYGNVTFIGRSMADSNAIRMQSPEFTTALLDALKL